MNLKKTKKKQDAKQKISKKSQKAGALAAFGEAMGITNDEEGKCRFARYVTSIEYKGLTEKKLFENIDNKFLIKRNKNLKPFLEPALKKFCIRERFDKKNHLKFCKNMLNCFRSDMMTDIIFSLYNQDYSSKAYKGEFILRKQQNREITQEEFESRMEEENIQVFANFLDEVIIKSYKKMLSMNPDGANKLELKKHLEKFFKEIKINDNLTKFSKDQFIETLKKKETRSYIETKYEKDAIAGTELNNSKKQVDGDRDLDIDKREYHKEKTPTYLYILVGAFLFSVLTRSNLLEAPPDLGGSFS